MVEFKVLRTPAHHTFTAKRLNGLEPAAFVVLSVIRSTDFGIASEAHGQKNDLKCARLSGMLRATQNIPLRNMPVDHLLSTMTARCIIVTAFRKTLRRPGPLVSSEEAHIYLRLNTSLNTRSKSIAGSNPSPAMTFSQVIRCLSGTSRLYG